MKINLDNLKELHMLLGLYITALEEVEEKEESLDPILKDSRMFSKENLQEDSKESEEDVSTDILNSFEEFEEYLEGLVKSSNGETNVQVIDLRGKDDPLNEIEKELSEHLDPETLELVMNELRG